VPRTPVPTTRGRHLEAIRRHRDRDGLTGAILDALDASRNDLGALTIADLVPLDHFYGGGLGFTTRLANLAGLTPGMHVLDVGVAELVE